MSTPSSGPRARTVRVAGAADGRIRVGELPAGPAGVATVPIPGGTAWVDPSAPEALPVVVVADPGAAAPVLARLLGPAVGLEVESARDGSVEVPAAPDEDAMRRLVQVATLRWLRGTRPLPIDAAALALEEAVALEDARDLLELGAVPGPGLGRLAPVTLALADVLRRPRTEGSWPGLPELVDDALRALLRGLPPDDPRAEDVRRELEFRETAGAPGPAARDGALWAELLALTRPQSAAHAGPGSEPAGPVREGRTAFDWAAVPPGVLDPAETAVRWRTEPDGTGTRIDVTVRSAASPAGLGDLLAHHPAGARSLRSLLGPVGVPDLRFRVYVPGFGLPLAHARLLPDHAAGVWHGVATLAAPGLDPASLVVDVHDTARPGPPPDAAGRLLASATRWAARGTALLRLALAAGDDVSGAAREPWEQARQLFATAAASGGTDADHATRCEARCAAVVVGLLEAAGDPRTARRRSRLAVSGPPVRPADVAVPDLRGGAWQPTVAELGILAAGR